MYTWNLAVESDRVVGSDLFSITDFPSFRTIESRHAVDQTYAASALTCQQLLTNNGAHPGSEVRRR